MCECVFEFAKYLIASSCFVSIRAETNLINAALRMNEDVRGDGERECEGIF